MHNVVQSEFMESIGCTDPDAAITRMAETIYDKWLDKKINGLIEDELGF